MRLEVRGVLPPEFATSTRQPIIHGGTMIGYPGFPDKRSIYGDLDCSGLPTIHPDGKKGMANRLAALAASHTDHDASVLKVLGPEG